MHLQAQRFATQLLAMLDAGDKNPRKFHPTFPAHSRTEKETTSRPHFPMPDLENTDRETKEPQPKADRLGTSRRIARSAPHSSYKPQHHVRPKRIDGV